MTSPRLIRTLGFLVFLTGFTTMLLQARGGRWEYLGQAHVDGAVDHDNIIVTASRGTFRAIQIRVERGPIRFDRVVVHYGDGRAEPIRIASRIPAGGQTRVIDLPGEHRVIERVEFWYERANWHERRPKVRLFGLH